jgi:HK97 gp10 family phage protein
MIVRAAVTVVKNEFPRLASTFERNVADGMNTGIANFVSAADAVIPRDTGAMAANVVISQATPGDLTGGVGYEQEYSGYVHDGTIYISPQPWARTVAEAMQDEYAAHVKARALGGLS